MFLEYRPLEFRSIEDYIHIQDSYLGRHNVVTPKEKVSLIFVRFPAISHEQDGRNGFTL